MTAFPLGAAGRYETAGQSVPDRVISSYAPTVRSLLSVRARHGISAALPRVLGVSMPHTEGQRDLPGTGREMEVLHQLFAGCEVLEGEQAMLEAVKTRLRSANWAHFACHGLSDRVQPEHSILLLQDYLVHPLTVVELSRLKLQAAEFAFLSSCSTGSTAPRLADEAIHITGGCLLAGFRSVVGTLWMIDDDVAVDIAEQVYAVIKEQGIGAVARALHDSLAAVRTRYPRSPSLWAAHVHVGA
jgi:CHAT domain-containing protein